MAPDGYAWWYLDALSDDGRHGLTIIAFIGSVFSPYYAQARRRGRGDPRHHVALNIALYGEGAQRWAMTERGRDRLTTTADILAIGPSAVTWNGTSLTVRIDEITVPWPSRLRGEVRLHPTAVTNHRVTLDGAGRHHWWPIAPSARVEVALTSPSLAWSGPGYLDSNRGTAPLEQDFTDWDWSRASLKRGTAMLYDASRRDGSRLSLALQADPSGQIQELEPPPPSPLPRTGWGIRRSTRADPGHTPKLQETLENAPFYARSLVCSHLCGEPVAAMHESLSLDRFAQRWVQTLLPFRMPRRA